MKYLIAKQVNRNDGGAARAGLDLLKVAYMSTCLFPSVNQHSKSMAHGQVCTEICNTA
jgi:hypothetical protein